MLSSAQAVSFDFAALRAREFARLDAQDHAYLDYTGSALYGSSQLERHVAQLQSGLFGNPHSESPTSRASTRCIEEARARVLRHFGVDASTHVVCFTANTSAAIKLVAESFPFAPGQRCVLTADNHNSVNGIREYARRAGASVRILPLDEQLRLAAPESELARVAGDGGLFAYPAQSNFSGLRHPLSLVAHARSLGFAVLLDLAARAPGEAVDLRACPADFATVSFYKMFGYPTGLGALIARRESLARLRRPWFSGGTVVYASVRADRHRLLEGPEGFEDGTPDFLSVSALSSGFDLLEEVGMARLAAHTRALTRRLREGLEALRHRDGAPLVLFYGPSEGEDRGNTVTFNVLDRDGQVLPYPRIEVAARACGISLRGGCFCNPGASEVAFGLDRSRLDRCLERLDGNFSANRFADCAGVEVGAVRVSTGLANNDRDVDRMLNMVASFACSTGHLERRRHA